MISKDVQTALDIMHNNLRKTDNDLGVLSDLAIAFVMVCFSLRHNPQESLSTCVAAMRQTLSDHDTAKPN